MSIQSWHLVFLLCFISAHHCTCHSMDQSLVGQKVDKRAAVAGHLCSVSRSDCGPDTGEVTLSTEWRGEESELNAVGPVFLAAELSGELDKHPQRRFHAVNKLRWGQEDSLWQRDNCRTMFPPSPRSLVEPGWQLLLLLRFVFLLLRLRLLLLFIKPRRSITTPAGLDDISGFKTWTWK